MNPKPMESFPASANLRDPVMTCLKHPHRLMYVSTQSPAGDAVFGSCGTFVTQCLVGICKQVGINHLRVAVQSQSPYSYLFPSLATMSPRSSVKILPLWTPTTMPSKPQQAETVS